MINRDGVALAASNWRAPRSNVGVDYAFRPYYQQALATGSGSFYGIGMTPASQAISCRRPLWEAPARCRAWW
ncbi:hypothetical protein B9W05_00020 [Xanthomonas oryzae pv. oryzae]|nr:hypothetical protein B9W05_00020 [Xanthomonas oryzae pv. oryzae]